MGDEPNPAMKPASPEQAVFAEALSRATPEARAAYLDATCGNDTALRERVEALLRAADAAGNFLEEPPTGLSGDRGTTLLISPLSEKPGDRIGRYKLLQQIGEGGCGVVYMAEQEEPVRRRVALKVIKLGMDTKSVIARFEAERQALALMDHPNIAKVLDAGATETGRPYFVMELVRGIKITDYCDQHNLSTEERLKLFTQVCQAIQHAHQKGIIHRDIKPSNILVTVSEPGAAGCPKVIDFGIAKATNDQRLTDKTVFTAFEQFIGTPAYMSPEQALMTSLDIDTRTDIYALGVLLYELLTGRTPFDAEELMASGLDAMRRTIREQEPARPSTRLSTMLAADLTTVARHRHAEPARLGTLLSGDLDWIVMKALEKERARRYETANALAADVQRHLSNEPVVARPPNAGYRFQKLVRRNKLAFAAVMAVAMALVLGAMVSTWQAIRATHAERQESHLRRQADEARIRAEAEQRKAETEATRSRHVAQFLKEMLAGVESSVALGRDTVLLKEILDNTAARVGKDLTGQPEVEADLRSTIGAVYHELGDFKKAAAMHRQALGIRRELLGREHSDVADSLASLGRALYGERKFAESEAVHREALALRIKLFGNEHLDVAASFNGVGNLLRAQGALVEAESMHRQAVAIRKRLLGPEHLEVADSLRSLALGILRQGKVAESEQLHRESLAIRRKLLGHDNLDVADSLEAVAGTLEVQGKLREAETLYHESVAIRRRLDPEHPRLARTLSLLARMAEVQEQLTEAEAFYREALALFRKRLGSEHPDIAEFSRNFGVVLCRQGKLVEAEALFREVIAPFEKSAALPTAPESARELGWIYNQLGILLRNSGREPEASLELQKARAIWLEHPDRARIERTKSGTEAAPKNVHRWSQLGEAYLDSGDWLAAKAAYLQCDRLGSSAYQWFPLAIVHSQLGQPLEARAWFDKALHWMDGHQDIKLRQLQAATAVTLGLPDPWGRSQKARTQFKRGDAFRQQGENEPARVAYAQAMGIYESLLTDFPKVRAYRNRLAELQNLTAQDRKQTATRSTPKPADE